LTTVMVRAIIIRILVYRWTNNGIGIGTNIIYCLYGLAIYEFSYKFGNQIENMWAKLVFL